MRDGMDDAAASRPRVGVEIGGTFTDLVWQRADGTLATVKVPSTPAAIHQAILDALAEGGIALPEIGQIVHGSTVATNALLTRDGASAALITTAGFRDVIEIGTHARSGNIYDILYHKPPSPIPRALTLEVPERIGADGSVILPLDEDAARAVLRQLAKAGVAAIAISLLHAYANPRHEQRLMALAAEEAPGIPVFASHIVSPEFREFERSMTTAVNAFVGPVVRRYIDRLESELAARGYDGVLQVMQSSGGVMPAAQAGAGAVRMLLSGPAAGMRGALWFAARNGIADIVTFDMGGTSTDVGIASDLKPRLVHEIEIDRLPIRIPAVDLVTVGAGGGSIARVDEGGFLAVGPKSAGAQPGPACYGRGGMLPTVTDAQVMAGVLRPARFFGGKLTLDMAAAERALGALDQPGGLRGAADAVLRIVNANMAQAVRLVSTARGIDPRGHTLVAYGGGGPLHGALVAAEIGMRRVLVPWSPGLASAFGLLVAETVIDIAATRLRPVDETSFDAATVARLQRRAAEAASDSGLPEGSWTAEIGLDLRYAGQAFELTVWLPQGPASVADLRARFAALHLERYGYQRASLPLEAVNERLRVLRAAPGGIATPPPPDTPAPIAERAPIRLDGTELEASFLPRAALPAGFGVAGPAVIEEPTATTLVPPGWEARVLPSGDLLLEAAP
ncbi:hydantoinase/oxoprolinase family protein [Roseomonas sp. F4]